MKRILLGLLLSTSALAENSRVIPAFLEATYLYINGEYQSHELLYIKPDIRAALEVLEKSKIDQKFLIERTADKSPVWPLRADDKYDHWPKLTNGAPSEVPELAVQATKFTVIDQSDWLGDDVYAYFFITDGVIPTGKVTSIYRSTNTGQSFFFNEIDRAIFPLVGIPAKRPENHLIIDFGVVESDGEDIKKMQQLSNIIIDIAIAVYTSYDPQNAEILIKLRKEIKALNDMLLSLNSDDRLATCTIAWKASELEVLLRDQTYVDFYQKFKGGSSMSTWEYKINFRLLKK